MCEKGKECNCNEPVEEVKRIVKKILILHIPYTVIEPERLSDADSEMEGAAAYCDLIMKEICVPRKSEEGILHSEIYRKEILEHEIIHALINEGGYGGDHPGGEETLVEMIRFISSYIRTTGVLKCLS